MAKALVLCPETETMELIEYIDTPLGALIHRCSLYQPSAVSCGRACATGARCALAENKGEGDADAEDTAIEIDVFPQAPTDVDLPG